ncbi:FAD-dependent oxidoreductase [Microcoleus sp. PH2017_05_CCC_O_A]|uniref:FAD-dependent oxidoreductase n=1 Tax=Microcoleus sp. PH2017_05_CCC_O_A TaxID=2798816 RepID=UPI001DE533AE|nr:FAD-dependent oxidoreductase [Microcoleus sp. PH2017_05_CCC_O_A]MCC3436255.1 FAD-dependent oxidoreductase [Microcoleus sp. PH2017_05_CCC_O_A]TAG39128.1 MAG: FAD-dependent oxidoreductase [Oscillatoriales cyanobacterium]
MPFTFKKLAAIAIFFVAVKILVDSGHFQQAANDITHRNPASATSDTETIRQKSSSPPAAEPHKSPDQKFDVVVYGDEVPGICAAIWAKKTLGEKGKVAVVRSNYATALLGGVLTRGGLGYVDLDKIPDWYRQPYAQCFREFLDKANVPESCLEPKTADKALREMLSEAGVKLISHSTLTPHVVDKKIEYAEVKESNIKIQANSFIDVTQDAELARKAGLSYYTGYESQNIKSKNETLAVSVVPTITGLTMADFRKIEDDILYDTPLVEKIKASITKYKDPASTEFWMRNFLSPIYQAYRDGYNIRSVAIGAAYHVDRNLPFTQDKGFFFDKANVCAYKDNSLSWNGFLFKYQVDELMKMEANGRKPNAEMVKEMSHLQEWLQKKSGKDVRVFIPEEIYIRQTLNVRDVVAPLSGKEIIKGGTDAEKSIGSFSYDFDLRGGVKDLESRIPPLPTYNFGIESALASKVSNLAIVGRSSGYVGMAVSVGRIATVNIYQGQGVGVAAGLASKLGVPLNTITSSKTRETLETLTGKTTYLSGRDTSYGVDYKEVK